MNPAMPAGLSELAGGLRLTPGAPLPHALASTRQDWAARLGHGVPPTSLPGLMASLFNLCGQAHRRCSELAIGAAAPDLLPPPEDVAETLRRETVQEHIRRIGLDWPHLLAPDFAPQAVRALRACPSPTQAVADDREALRGWLQQHLLHRPPADWLAGWMSGGEAWLVDWCAQQPGWLPELLRSARTANVSPPLMPGTALRPHGDAMQLRTLGEKLSHTPAFALRPKWQGACAHTGPWSRLRAARHDARHTPWGLLGARLAELARLTLPEGDTWLSWGSVSTGPRRGLAWVEMARGLLVHQVEMDVASGRVQSCRVVAPTEWNFHPLGEVAQRLAGLDARQPAADLERQVHLLVAGFDPCVPFIIERPKASRLRQQGAGDA